VEENVMRKWVYTTTIIFLFLAQNCKSDELANFIFPTYNDEVATFSLWYSPVYEVPDPIVSTIVNWDNIVIEDNIGNTLFRDRQNDTEFDAFCVMLTNGIDDHYREDYNGTTSGETTWGEYESRYFGSFSLNGIDLEGYNIDSIGLTIESTSRVTYTIHGSLIPEPCTLSLILLGGIALAKRRKRRSVRP
jgi:hypothetical protein